MALPPYLLKVHSLINMKGEANNYNEMGRLYYNKQEYDIALKLFNESLYIQLYIKKHDKNYIDRAIVHNNIGLTWDVKEKYNEAIEAYKKAIERNPIYTEAYDNLTYLLRRLGSKYKKEKNYVKVIDYYNRALLLHKKILSYDPKKYTDEVFEGIHQIIQTYKIIKPKKAKEIYTKSLNYYQELFKQDKKSHAKNYIKMIIEGVEQFDLDSNRLNEAKEILDTLPKNSETKGLLLQIEALNGGYGIYIFILSTLFFGGTIFYFKRYKNPLIVTLSDNPKKLKTLNPTQLKEANLKLKLINQLDTTLDLANISKENFENTLLYFKSQNDKKAELFAERIGAIECKKKGEFYQITMGDDFNLNNIRTFLLYITDKNIEAIKR